MTNPEQYIQVRYCPKCGVAARGTVSQFERPVNCPNCKQPVTMFAYPTDPPEISAESATKNKLITKTLIAAIILAMSLAIIATVLVITGQFFTTFLLALVLMIIGTASLIICIERHQRVDLLEQKLADADLVKKELLGGVNKWNALELSIDSVKRELEMKTTKQIEEIEEEKIQFAHSCQEKLEEIEEHRGAVQTVAEKYVQDIFRMVMKDVTSSNFATSTQKIVKAIEYCRKKGAVVTNDRESEIKSEIRERYEDVVRRDAAREEQRRIKERIREEERANAEIEREMNRLEKERIAIERALNEAIAKTKDSHSAEIEDLRRRLSEAEDKTARVKSRAEQTRSGNVYVISNIGSFGDGVFKVGMTRRLDPTDRVKELGDASVPFKFDVHMMIACEDAPKLEATLHRALNDRRCNKVNLRKEFFRTSIDEIVNIVTENHGRVDYVATPEALEYFESENLQGDDLEFVDSVLHESQTN